MLLLVFNGNLSCLVLHILSYYIMV